MEITEISKNYQVRRLGRDDVDAIYELCRENRIFYRYHEPFVTKESILDDMEALPPGKSREDKYYVGFFEGGSLAAIMDLILGYPEKNTAFIGLFMTDVRYQHRGVGSQIISGLAAYLSACGCEKIRLGVGFRRLRLGVDKGNPQSHAFWTKNRFQTIGEARYIVMEREI